jgi:hypothetical protein
MAKGVATGSKSDAIRELLAQNPKMKVKDVVATLAANGTKVTANLVYYTKKKLKLERRKEARARAAELSRSAGVSDPVQLIMKVKSLAGEAGGYRHLKQLVDALAE